MVSIQINMLRPNPQAKRGEGRSTEMLIFEVHPEIWHGSGRVQVTLPWSESTATWAPVERSWSNTFGNGL